MSANLPAPPSNIKGPASFLGVIGPSEPGTASVTEDGTPLGLGVLTVPRPEQEPGLSRREEAPTGRLEALFRPAISTGGTVAFDISGPRELDELRGFGDGSSMFR